MLDDTLNELMEDYQENSIATRQQLQNILTEICTRVFVKYKVLKVRCYNTEIRYLVVFVSNDRTAGQDIQLKETIERYLNTNIPGYKEFVQEVVVTDKRCM